MQDKNYPDIKKILTELSKHLGVKGIRGLAAYLGQEESRLYAWVRNKNIVDTGIILTKCPNINREWLKTGQGPMLAGYEGTEHITADNDVAQETSPTYSAEIDTLMRICKDNTLINVNKICNILFYSIFISPSKP